MGVLMKEAKCNRWGILILWDRRTWRGELFLNGNQSITGMFSGENDDFSWYLNAVYADCKKINK